MRGKIDIPPTIKEFMDLYVQDYYPELNKNIFSGAPSFSNETDMYKWITDTINNSDVVDSNRLVCASTPYKSDRNDSTHQAVDLGLYPTKFKPINEGDGEYNRRVNWSRIDLSIECKVDPTDQDPFDESADDLLPIAADRKKALGQILTYVENVFMHQHRTLHYMILFLGHYARIVRFDHSGVYSTTKFNYKTHGAILTTFLYRYSARDAAQRGHDPTATRLELRDPLVAQMRKLGQEEKKANPDDHVQRMFNASLDNAWPWYKLEVHVQRKSGEPEPPRGRLRSHQPPRITRSFVVGKPHFDAGGVVGRGTRGYVAVEVDAGGQLVGPFVYLKDAWRVDHDGIEQEGCVLEELNHHKVPFVPTLVCHGDLKGQVTESQDAWAKRKVKNPQVKRTFKKHQHYRLVVAEVGKPLEEFGSGFKLVSAVFCCLLAHQAAYEKAGIIHRDISSGNILLYQGANGVWMGLLNDWELSKRVDSPAARQPDRTGTWQFMSARALNNPDKEILVEDEIEAFFHVLLFHAVRFLPHSIHPDRVPKFLEDYFDSCVTFDGEYRCGSAKSMAMEGGFISITTYNLTPTTLKFVQRNDMNTAHILDELISRLLCSFKEVYAEENAPGQPSRPVPAHEDVNAFWSALGQMSNVEADAPPVTPPKPTKVRSRGKSRAPKASRRRGQRKVAPAHSDQGPAPISLREHRPVIALFREFMTRATEWPTDDKGEDLRVKYVKAEDTVGLAPNRSRKHTLDNAQPAPSTSKRSRI
ncbi:hypothetical protein L226DRAFT_541035 [Lentinus tigrinus ALCF2SS1-7]|uniref:Protein kinase domain-containing protein n=1 Tax=Lentinus tigrinus ALCF2SS1-6 TaxID=1328759 RepID=A0A5C2RNR6_9APHY|nr:hypothetical protein L227DRAFT_558456 [Lentinus tigrinus ALCF2SS1-6]RPD68087.1 hypothetical protein L226DRAFT_541035 [Lentinus tigrinus ALCF2SS1-7]